MNDDRESGAAADPVREIQALQKKLARAELRMESLEMLQEQNAHLMRALLSDLDAERAESERLLLNILPEPIAQRLKTETGVIADRYESVSVLFADIVGFTPLSERLTAEEMVEWLNDVYSALDALVEKHGVEKIRTIGDGYMVAAGVPFPREDHASAITRLALDIRAHFEAMPPIQGHKTTFRIGINSGAVVGGVIGTHKFQYDLWGDAVNTAARMESHGIPGHIQITDTTRQLLGDEFTCEARGKIDVKGKGEMNTWLVIG